MANIDSTTVANLEATPNSVADAALLYGKKRVALETIDVLAAHNDNDTYALFPLPLDCRVSHIYVGSAGITGGTDYNVGAYTIVDNDIGVAIDDNLFADAISLAAAGLLDATLDTGSGINATNYKQKLWQQLGYASIEAAREANPTNQVYVVATGVTVGTADGTAFVQIEYVVE